MVLASLRNGDWLSRERMRLVAFAVAAASLVGVLFLLVTSSGLNDYQGRPLGTDFSNVYAAGTLVLEGRAAAPFDPPQQHAQERKIFGDATPFYGWHYPPFFLFIAAALALMPYLLALAVWQSVTLAFYLGAIFAILRFGPAAHSRETQITRGKFWLLVALAYPAVFINLGHGHNGFLTAALLGVALVLLDRRPLIAGILFGLVAYKPQFGLMIPIALVAGGYWRACFAAAATVVMLALATTLIFGSSVWEAFMASTHFTRVIVLESGDTGWHKIQSVFSWVRMWGGPVSLAYAVQGAMTIAVGACLAWLWRSEAAYPLKAAALAIAVVLGTPYSLDYDLMVLAPAIAFLVADGLGRGFGPYEKTALAALWLMPLIARALAQAALIPLAVPVMLIVFALILQRAASDLGTFTRWSSAELGK
jgi:alpha-1,2-mannosyltransferase